MTGVPLKVLGRESPVSKHIPYSHHITPTIISTKAAQYLSVWRIAGRPSECAAPEDIYSWAEDLNNLLRGIGSEHVSLWTHVIRRRADEYPDSEFKQAFARALDERYQGKFRDSLINELYLTVLWSPASNDAMGFFAQYERLGQREKLDRQTWAVKALDDINRTLGQSLAPYGGRLLGLYEHNGLSYSEPAEFLSHMVNGQFSRVPVCRDRICEYIAQARPFFSDADCTGLLRLVDRDRHFGMVETSDYPEATEPGHLSVLMGLPFEFVLTQSFSVYSRHAARGFLKRHRQYLEDSRDVAVSQIEGIDRALDELESGHFIMGDHHATLTVFGSGAAEVRKNLASAVSAFQDVSIMTRPLILANVTGWWAQLPGNWRYRPRPAAITSQNFAAFNPLHNAMTGKLTGNPWGPAITVFKGQGGTPLFFNFHASRPGEDDEGERMPGNTLILGKTGSGKTTLVNFLLCQAQKFSPTVVAFDKDRGLESTILALGGKYLPLSIGQPSGFNPFACPPTPGNLAFLKSFIRSLAGDVSVSDEAEIDRAVEALMHSIDPADRRLGVLMQFLPSPAYSDRMTLHSRLQRWCEGGEFGWLFDNAADELHLIDSQIWCFDVTEFLEHSTLRGPVMSYLFHRSEALLDGRRFVYVLDEFWRMLSDPFFADLVKNKMKTIRKQNGLMICATQQPDDVLKSEIGKTIGQQAATIICLSNPGADPADYIEGLKLTEAEFARVKELGEVSRRFLIKQGSDAAVAELDLHGFPELPVLAGRREVVENA